jgi:hypothetical protein
MKKALSFVIIAAICGVVAFHYHLDSYWMAARQSHPATSLELFETVAVVSASVLTPD